MGAGLGVEKQDGSLVLGMPNRLDPICDLGKARLASQVGGGESVGVAGQNGCKRSEQAGERGYKLGGSMVGGGKSMDESGAPARIGAARIVNKGKELGHGKVKAFGGPHQGAHALGVWERKDACGAGVEFGREKQGLLGCLHQAMDGAKDEYGGPHGIAGEQVAGGNEGIRELGAMEADGDHQSGVAGMAFGQGVGQGQQEGEVGKRAVGNREHEGGESARVDAMGIGSAKQGVLQFMDRAIPGGSEKGAVGGGKRHGLMMGCRPDKEVQEGLCVELCLGLGRPALKGVGGAWGPRLAARWRLCSFAGFPSRP